MLTRYHRIFTLPEHHGKVVLFSTKTAATLLVPATLIDEIERDTLSAEDRALLTEHGFLVESAEAERREMLTFLDDLVALDKVFNPTIVLNLDCNLACTYCFEGTRKGRHYLSEETARRLLDFIRDRGIPGRDEVHVIFYGGEPLLSIERMAFLAQGIGALANAAAIPFGFSLITNGTLLTRAAVERLRPLGLRSASVTLDGPRGTHDAARPYRDGRRSFDVILANLREVAGLVDLQVGGNYTRENWREFPRLLDDLVAAGLGPGVVSKVKFDPVVQEREGIAPPDFHGGCTSINEPWIFEASVALRGEILRRGYETPRIMPSTCMLDFPGRMVIAPDGAIYGCSGVIGRAGHRVGTIHDPVAPSRQHEQRAGTDVSLVSSQGNEHGSRGGAEGRASVAWTEGSTMEVRSDRTLAPRTWQNDECLACAYLPLCFGGCRYLKLLRDGDTAGQDCRRPHFDAVLAEMVAQDLRHR